MKFSAEATARKESGKGVARQIRRNGKIPAVVYGRGKSQLLEMDPSAVAKILMAQAGSTGLVSLRISDGTGETEKTVVIQDHQVDPITGLVLHVDLFEVDMKKTVRVKVQVHITGSVPVGVKVDKGVLHQHMREFHIECLPNALPDQIDIDASELGLGDGIHVRDVQPGPGIKILDDPGDMVVNVAAQISDEKLAAMLAGEPSEAPAAAPTEAAPGDKAKAEAAPAAAKAGEPKK